jgi:D-3-phosphoglycerate dehydrogenase
MDNVVCTPHLGYVDRDTYEKYYGAAVDSILAYAEGKPINVLNPDVLKKTGN